MKPAWATFPGDASRHIILHHRGGDATCRRACTHTVKDAGLVAPGRHLEACKICLKKRIALNAPMPAEPTLNRDTLENWGNP